MITAIRRNLFGIASAGLVLLGLGILQLDSVVVSRLHASSDPMCGEEEYDPVTQGCCDGSIYDLETEGCCEAGVYDLETEACCGEDVYNVEEEGCCEDEVYDLEDEGCCDGQYVYVGETHYCCESCGCVIARE